MYPQSLDPNAPVTGRHSAVVAAPLDVVWAQHTDVANYPRWQPELQSAHIDGPFVPGVTFDWQTASFDIRSTLYAVEPQRRTLWGGTTAGVTGIHEWTFAEVDGGVLVETAESWDGDVVRADVPLMQKYCDDALLDWLQRLAVAAESAS